MPKPTLMIRIAAESDEDHNVFVVAVKPTWRDVPAILRGRYVPRVERIRRATPQGVCRAVSEIWTAPKVREQLYGANPLLTMLRGKDDPTP